MTEVLVRPITIFFGANSSGKSTCIHAIGALSQTLKLSNNRRPLILDDEFAQIHLGRFIEILHSKSYQDTLTLGIDIPPFPRPRLEIKGTRSQGGMRTDPCTALFTFKSTKRTQDTTLERAEYTLGAETSTIRRKGGKYEYTSPTSTGGVPVTLKDGFLPTFEPQPGLKMEDLIVRIVELEAIQTQIRTELRNTLYLGPFRQPPLRRYPTRGANPSEVGAMGEAAITMLANETVQTQMRPHIAEVAKWLSRLGLATKLDVNRVGSSDLFDVSLTLSDAVALPIADLGYGLSQVLPVLVQCSFAPEGSTLLFEQPELHLHSLAARPLAGVFIDTAKNKRAHIIVETHSRELVSQFQRELRKGRLSLDEIACYKVAREEGATTISRIDIDDEDYDIYELWEKGVTQP